MLCEGEKMLGEALRSGAKLKTVLVRRRLGQSAHRGKPRHRARRSIVRRMRCSGLPARWKRRRTSSFPASSQQWTADALDGAGQVLLLDGFTGPGQPLARSLRTAEAFALSASCVVARAAPIRFHLRSCASTMGAVFRLPCVTLLLTEAAERLHKTVCRCTPPRCMRDSVPLSLGFAFQSRRYHRQ